MKRALWLFASFAFASIASAQDAGVPDAEAPPPEVAPADGEVAALDESELSALGLDLAGPRVDTSFHFWGFADFTSSSLIKPEGAQAVAQGRHQTFYIGNLNVYLSKNLSESFRTMAEVRFTYLPNGTFSANETGYAVQDTTAIDYASGQSPTKWGGIIIQRVYLEWQLHRLIAVRGGQFLTPVGIWNVDHGSPAYIPVQRPLAIVSRLFPTWQTGLEALGRWSPGNDDTVGYHLTLSNGTGPISEYKDLDRNKAIGWRFYWERMNEKSFFRLGTSGYYGQDTSTTNTASFEGTTIRVGEKVGTQSDNLTTAADVLLKFGPLHLQAEWVGKQTRYTDKGRTVHATVGAPVSSAASADDFSWATYALAAYRFDWYKITPFLTFQAGNILLINQSLPDARFTMVGATGGLNISPIDDVVFKLEAARVRFPQAPAILKYTTNVVLVQAAWAF